MTTNEFVERYHLAPFSIEEFALGAMRITDNEKLASSALRYISAKEDFLKLLLPIVEIG